MKDLITYIAKALVHKPEEVVVREIKGEQICAIELKVAKEDIGKILIIYIAKNLKIDMPK